ncbi:MAG: Hsp20/alpha crystallin family protein [Fusobacteriaceae bacterium]
MSNLIKKRDFFNTATLKEFFDDEEDFFNKVFKRKSFPLINVTEEKEKYHLEMSIPGVAKEKIKLTRDAEKITIQYEDEKVTEEGDKNYHKKEFHKDSFIKTFPIPDDVELDGITSEHKDGVLTLELPKKPEAIERKNQVNIEIK